MGDAKIFVMSRKAKKYALIILAVFIIILIIFIGYGFLPGSRARKISGIYLTTGGETFIAIKPGAFGFLRVTDGRLFITESVLPSENSVIYAKPRNDFLYLYQEESDKSISSRDTYNRITINVTLKPSENIPGDWDLIEWETWNEEICRNKIFGKKFFKDLRRSDSIEDVKETLKSYIKKRNPLLVKRHYSGEPLPSFLHRVDDSRIIEYFRIRQNGLLNKEALELSRAIADNFQGDSYIELHRVEMEALSGNPEKSLSLWEKWKQSHHFLADPFLRILAERVSVTVMIEKQKRGNPGWVPPQNFFHWEYYKSKYCPDPMEPVEYYKKYLHSDQIFFYNIPIVPPLEVPGRPLPPIPDFLRCQTYSKVLITNAVFYLFEGRREEALEIMVSVYRMGQSFNSHGILIQRLIGVAMRRIATYALTLYVLNACESEEEFQRCWNALEKLNDTPHLENSDHFRSGISTLLYSQLELSQGPNYPEAETRHNAADMEFQLLRMALAARRHLVFSGRFPETEEDFAPFFPDGLPIDVFADGAPLRFIRISDDEFAAYSLGPDRDDDSGRVLFDFRDGMTSDGDLTIQIPRKRKYPFPKDGVRAANAYELLQIFPRGLPRDLFADSMELPLSVIESTETDPVIIFSFGPDTDERKYKSFVMDESGMDSLGGFDPVPTPEPGSAPPLSRKLQKVMRRSDQIPPPPGRWTLHPRYDPTNGTITPGDIFLEIPR